MNAETRTELLDRLLQAQNHPANWNVDITTFGHLCPSLEQLARHVAYYEARITEAA